MPSTFRMRASHRQGETADPPLRKVCPFTVVCWEAASAGAWKPIVRRRRRPSPLDCMAASPKLPRLFLSAGLENVLRMSPTRSLLHLLGRGAGPVIRRVWTLTCDRETRRPRPRRDGAKPTGAGAPRHWRSGILWLAAAERNCVAVALGSGTLCKTGLPARGEVCPGGALRGLPF